MNRIWLATALACALACPAWAGGANDPTTFEAGRAAVKRARGAEAAPRRARNVVLFVGDGMGVSTVTAARIFAGQLRGEPGEEHHLAFEEFPHLALAKTYNTNQQTPDSAGTMTALVTGAKTRAGVLSVNRSVPRGDFEAVAGNELRTIVEQAEERGLATGFVTTTTVTHATPAALYAHSPDRGWADDGQLPPAARQAGFADIARQFVEFPVGDGIEVALGGGLQHFLPRATDLEASDETGLRQDGRDLTAEWKRRHANSAFIWNRKQLLGIDAAATDHLLGLFNPSHLTFEVDRGGEKAREPSLSEMTAVAVSLLKKNANGFFLMVEGGRIDHAHHAGNAYRALHETVEFARAVEAVLAATDPSETLIIVTADHSHVLTMAGYPTRGNDILGKVVTNDIRGEPEKSLSLDAKGRPYTTLGYQNGPGASSSVLTGSVYQAHEGSEKLGTRGEAQGRPDLTDVDTTHPDFLQEAAVPFDYETHSGEDVAVYAIGPGADLFHGVIEQHYVYHAMVEALGWNQQQSFLSRLLGRSGAY
jgi:alkaline phosphatase